MKKHSGYSVLLRKKRKETRLKRKQQPDENKFRQLILYIAQKSEQDPRCGATKLNKLLFYSDFLAYRHLGQAITGQEYMRLPKGPVPRRYVQVRNAMHAAGQLRQKRVLYGTNQQHRVVALKEPDMTVFSSKEVALIDDVVEMNWFKNATEISDQSHRFIGWLSKKDYDTIPYEMAMIHIRPLFQDEIKYGEHLADNARQEQASHATV